MLAGNTQQIYYFLAVVTSVINEYIVKSHAVLLLLELEMNF